MSNVVAAPLGTLLIRRRGLATSSFTTDHSVDSKRAGILFELRHLGWTTLPFWSSIVLLLACTKASAYISDWITFPRVTFPVQVGAMIVGLAIRNLHDALGLRWLNIDAIDRIGSVVLALFLVVAMMTLDLSKLGAVALPMLIILLSQVVLLAAYGYWLNSKLMGGDYEAAVTTTGLMGFALGATPNAMAAMRSLERAFGPAPKAFLVVPVTGAFLSDVLNVLVITGFLNLLR